MPLIDSAVEAMRAHLRAEHAREKVYFDQGVAGGCMIDGFVDLAILARAALQAAAAATPAMVKAGAREITVDDELAADCWDAMHKEMMR